MVAMVLLTTAAADTSISLKLLSTQSNLQTQFFNASTFSVQLLSGIFVAGCQVATLHIDILKKEKRYSVITLSLSTTLQTGKKKFLICESSAWVPNWARLPNTNKKKRKLLPKHAAAAVDDVDLSCVSTFSNCEFIDRARKKELPIDVKMKDEESSASYCN